MTCDEVRVALGALVIGALDPDESSGVRQHLDGCSECTAEHDELREMPRLLGLVTLTDATEGPEEPPAHLDEDLLRRAAEERRRERRRRLGWSVAGGVAIAAVAATVGFGLAEGASVAQPPDPDLQVLAAADETTGVRGQVKVDQVGWGSKLELQLAGAAAGETCSLVAVSTTGEREVTATWRVPPASGDGTYLAVPGAAAFSPALIDTFEVVTTSGSTLLSLTFDDLVTDLQVDDIFDY